MAITPEMIGEKSFSSQFRGYNMDEVDDFLDLLLEEVDAMQKREAELTEKLAQAEKNGENAAGQEISNLQSLLRASRQRIAQLEADLRSASSGDDEALRAQLTRAQQRIAELEARPAADPEETRALRAELARAQQHIAELETRPAQDEVAALQHQLKLAKKRIAELEAVTGNPENLLSQINTAIDTKVKAAQEDIQDTVLAAKADTTQQLEAALSQLAAARQEYQALSQEVAEVKTRYMTMLKNQMSMFDLKD